MAAISQIRRGIFRGQSSRGTWLYTILKGKVADYWRKAGAHTLVPLEAMGGSAAGSLETLEKADCSGNPELSIGVDEILQMLPARQRCLLILMEQHGYKIAEISEKTGWPTGTVGRVLAEARKEFLRLWRKFYTPVPTNKGE